ncbi:MAG: PIN domain-like protein [Benjaminiella poitrasii]|nr:MAG: PIN domain-like protein [Benjaminiella poitrasii]
MGIHGLSFFIKSFPSIVDNIQWEIDLLAPSTPRDHFIVDGNAFVYHIAFENRIDWTHGGQYATIAHVVENFASQLLQAGIKMTFVFDGALPEDKIKTRIKRQKSYIERCVTTYSNLKQINASNKNPEGRLDGIQYYGDLFLIPPLTLEVVVQTLRELNVEIKICEAEADGEVVSLAIEKMAYVVSQDSDMHVYPNVGKGYIPLELLSVPTSDTAEDERRISASVFRPEAFATLLNIEPTQLPLFGTLLGNDYLDSGSIRYPINQWYILEGKGAQNIKTNSSGWPKVVADFINKNSHEGTENIIKNIVDQLKPVIMDSSMKSKEQKAANLEDQIVDSISRYDTRSPLLHKYKQILDKTNQDENTTQIETILKQSKHYSNGFSRQTMDVIKSKTFWASIFLEDIEREFSWDVSRYLRQGLYDAISESMEGDEQPWVVEEQVREKQHLDIVQVTRESRQRKQNKLEDFYSLHNSHSLHLTPHNSILHPFILSMRYMIYHCSQSIYHGRLYNYEIIAMIVSGLKSLAPILGYTSSEVALPTMGIPTLKKRSIHLAAQFQSIVYSSYLLSQVLDIPNHFQLPHVLSHIYNGLYFHYYIEYARGGASIGKLLSGVFSVKFKTLFCKVYYSVMKDLEEEVQNVFDYGVMASVEQWLTTLDNKPKRFMQSQKSLSQRPEKKKRSSSSTTLNSRNNNAFNVLSFGCNFDDL